MKTTLKTSESPAKGSPTDKQIILKSATFRGYKTTLKKQPNKKYAEPGTPPRNSRSRKTGEKSLLKSRPTTFGKTNREI